jgi:hypothetical protein
MEINRPDTDFFVSVPSGLVTFARNNLVHDARQNMVLWGSCAIGRWLRCSGNLTRPPALVFLPARTSSITRRLAPRCYPITEFALLASSFPVGAFIL